MSNQQEANDIRYADCLAAVKECIDRGVSARSLSTLKYEMAIDPRDYKRIMDYCLRFPKLKDVQNAS